MSRPPAHTLSPRLVFTLSFGTAASVATLYLVQPILHLLGADLQVSNRTIGFLVTFTQLGYAAGIFTLVPLGDVVNKKNLILAKLSVLFTALLCAALSHSIVVLVVASFAIGIFSTAAQDFIPLAAELAEPQRRGQVIGTVMGGLLLGILCSRTFSGVIADHGGWRAVFYAAAALIALLAIVVWSVVPPLQRAADKRYAELIRSMITLVKTYPALGLSVLTQGLMGIVFSAFWTVLSFHLSADPFHLSASQIGYFGLAGAVGALAAPAAGKLADKHGPLFNIPLAIGTTFAAFVLMGLWPKSILVLVAGAAIFDLGVQMSMVSHQAIIYALEPSSRSRINAVYVGGIFIFFALGSFIGNAVFHAFGWLGVVAMCLLSCLLAFGVNRLLVRKSAGARAPAATPEAAY